MIVALKPGVTQESREQLMDWLQNLGNTRDRKSTRLNSSHT